MKQGQLDIHHELIVDLFAGNSVSPYPGAALVAVCHEGEEMRMVA
jgi:hypothetical protein